MKRRSWSILFVAAVLALTMLLIPEWRSALRKPGCRPR